MIDRTILLVGAGTFVAALVVPNLAGRVSDDFAAQNETPIVEAHAAPEGPARPASTPSQMGEVQPDGSILLNQQNDGHFHADPQINGVAIPMVVDTGATDLVLTEADAARAGIRPPHAAFNQRAETAGGWVVVAPVTIERVRLGRTELHGVEASVVRGTVLPTSLLGQSVLNRLESITISGGQMRLR
jgi:aspartyl protease family protein